jgi:nickel/cobalt transporter (NiCoT) family protein
VNNVGNDFDIIGGSICGLFVVCGIASVILYRPWRRWVDKNRNIVSIEGTELEVQDMDEKALDGKRFGTTEKLGRLSRRLSWSVQFETTIFQ